MRVNHTSVWIIVTRNCFQTKCRFLRLKTRPTRTNTMNFARVSANGLRTTPVFWTVFSSVTSHISTWVGMFISRTWGSGPQHGLMSMCKQHECRKNNNSYFCQGLDTTGICLWTTITDWTYSRILACSCTETVIRHPSWRQMKLVELYTLWLTWNWKENTNFSGLYTLLKSVIFFWTTLHIYVCSLCALTGLTTALERRTTSLFICCSFIPFFWELTASRSLSSTSGSGPSVTPVIRWVSKSKMCLAKRRRRGGGGAVGSIFCFIVQSKCHTCGGSELSLWVLCYPTCGAS